MNQPQNVRYLFDSLWRNIHIYYEMQLSIFIEILDTNTINF